MRKAPCGPEAVSHITWLQWQSRDYRAIYAADPNVHKTEQRAEDYDPLLGILGAVTRPRSCFILKIHDPQARPFV